MEKSDLQTCAIGFVTSRRDKLTPRALFIFNHVLIAIFWPLFLWGFKTPAICFYLQEKEEEETCVSSYGCPIFPYEETPKFGALKT